MRFFKKIPLRLLPIAISLALSTFAHAGLFDDDEARKQIAEVRSKAEQRDAELTSKLEQLEKQSGQKLLDLVNQSEQLNQQIANLRGLIESLNFTLESLQKRQKDLYTDLDQRLRAIEEGKPIASASTPANPQAAQQEAESASAYEAANKLFRDGKFKLAADAFGKIAKDYPTSTAGPNALFWSAMSQAQAGDGKTAELIFRRLIDAHPEHTKAPEALRAIATLQQERGDKKNAGKTLRELLAAYPSSEAARDAEKMLKKL